MWIIVFIYFKNRFRWYYSKTSMISVYIRYFFVVKVCSFIIVRYVFWFSKMSIVCRCLFFAKIGPNFITNSITFVQSVTIFNKKIHPIIIIQVINKVLLAFFHQKKSVSMLIYCQCLHRKKIRILLQQHFWC